MMPVSGIVQALSHRKRDYDFGNEVASGSITDWEFPQAESLDWTGMQEQKMNNVFDSPEAQIQAESFGPTVDTTQPDSEQTALMQFLEALGQGTFPQK